MTNPRLFLLSSTDGALYNLHSLKTQASHDMYCAQRRGDIFCKPVCFSIYDAICKQRPQEWNETCQVLYQLDLPRYKLCPIKSLIKPATAQTGMQWEYYFHLLYCAISLKKSTDIVTQEMCISKGFKMLNVLKVQHDYVIGQMIKSVLTDDAFVFSDQVSTQSDEEGLSDTLQWERV